MESRHSMIELQIAEGIIDEACLTKPALEPTTAESHRPVEIPVLTQTNTLPCIESNTMDFEFTNTDLVHGTEFSIDNASMFGIAESTFDDERSDCYDLFMESNCFGAYSKPNDHLLPGGVTSSLQSTCNVPVAVKDSNLMLQIIPLNNLQYVSTIQTDKGLHILAVPAGTIINQVSQSNVTSLSGAVKLCSSSAIVNERHIKETNSNNNFGLTLSKQSCTTVEIANNYIRANDHENGHISLTSTSPQSVDTNSAVKTISVTEALTTDNSCKMDTRNCASKKMVSLLNNSYQTSKQTNNQPTQMTKKSSNSIQLTIPVLQKDLKQKDIPLSKLDRKTTRNNFENQMKSAWNFAHVTKNDRKLSTAVIEISKNDGTVAMNEKTDNFQNKSDTETNTTIADDQSKNSQTEVIKENNSIKINKNESLVNQDDHESVFIGRNCQGLNVSERDVLNIDRRQDSQSTYEKETTFSDSVIKGQVSKLYTCVHCSAKFLKKGNLQNHYKLHKQLNSTVIEENGQKSTMDVKHSASDSTRTSVRWEDAGEGGRWLTCPQCEQTFTTPGNLTRHLLSHTSSSQELPRNNCGLCNRSFQQKCDLKRHELIHSGQFPYKCDICNKGFVRKSDLTVHSRFHLGKKSHTCNTCGKSYFQQGDLSRHVRQSHGDTCQFSCPTCQLKYTTRKTLAQHVKLKHSPSS